MKWSIGSFWGHRMSVPLTIAGGCLATVAGANFGLMPPSPGFQAAAW